MTSDVTLLEPSFSDLLAAVEQAADLSGQRRRHWVCSVRQIAKWLDRPLTIIPARWGSVQFAITQLHHARVGVTAKTLSNHRANTKAALHWFSEEKGLLYHGVRLSPEWERFRGAMDKPTAKRLYSLMRYCSARDIDPQSLDDDVFDQYWVYRGATSGLATDSIARRRMVRAWNSLKTATATPSVHQLAEPVRKTAELPWENFPAGLGADLDNYFAGLAKVHRAQNGKRMRPCKPTTIQSRRAALVAMARMAVKVGVPIESLTSLAALLHPDVAQRVLDAYWQQNGETPTTFTIDLGRSVLRIARETGCLDQAALERLDDMGFSLEQYRREGMTPKNLKLIRQVLTEGVWNEVVSLPTVLMQQASLAKDHAPIKAAVTAQLAAAIAILTFAPIRLSNLTRIELGRNLIRPGGPESAYWLTFPEYDVKNDIDLDFTFDQPLTDLIDEYVHEFRPTLLRGANSSWLFPGDNGAPKGSGLFGKQIAGRIQKATGLRITVHQFRHAAAAIYLKHNPGAYETVRRLLGHRRLQTTTKFYCGLETIQATEEFARLIRKHADFERSSNE